MPRARLWLCSTVCPTALVLASPYEGEDDDFVVICTNRAVLDFFCIFLLPSTRARSELQWQCKQAFLFILYLIYPAGKMTSKIRCFNVRYHVVAMSETSWI